jgi:myo-inositol catabolism protein IolS
MKTNKLGRTDIDISAVCLGCWGFSNDFMWPDQAERDSINTIHAALDQGINFLDTAEAYGNGYSEEVVGKALKGRRQDAVVASKAGGDHLAPDQLIQACEASLRRLDTDYIDLYQIHWPSRTIPMGDTLEALDRLKDQGKIRVIGVSNFGPRDMEELFSLGRAESNQLAYNLLWRAIEYEIQPICVENDLSILCYSPLLHGILTGKFATVDDVPDERARTRHFSSERSMTIHGASGAEAETFAALDGIRNIAADAGHPMLATSLAWLIARPGVGSVIAGARNPDQVEQIAASADIALDAETIAALDSATDPVKKAMGTNADMWRTESRIR